MVYENEVTKIYKILKYDTGKGKVAQYIPALSKINPNQYSISVCDLEGNEFSIGDSDKRFTIQSISKVFTLAMASKHLGDNLWDFVGREPSGTSFNSLIQLEQEKGIPRNPFLNAGALVVTDKLWAFMINLKKQYWSL